MYISKTTGAERQTISNAMFGIMDNVQRAERTARRVWDKYFSSEPIEHLEAYELEDVADILYLIANSLFEACTEYALTVNEEYNGIEKHRESAESACLSYKVDMLYSELIKSEKNSSTREKIKETLNLPDEEAIIILENIKGVK